MTPPAKLAHIVLKTSRKPEMVAWYCDVLEARIAYENDMLSFISYDDEHHRVAFVATAGAVQPTEGHSGLHHAAFTYASLGDLLNTYRRLDEHEIEPFWCVNHGPTTSMYFEDPDGNHVELQVDNFSTDAELDNYFADGLFDANPIGVDFDPDVLLRRFDAGEPASELVAQR